MGLNWPDAAVVIAVVLVVGIVVLSLVNRHYEGGGKG